MKREILLPRKNWQQRVEKLGLNFHSANGKIYWDESVCYHFSARQIADLEKATNELHQLCLAAVDHIIDQDLFSLLKISPSQRDLIVRSWDSAEKTLLGRFDFSYDGVNPPKLLEYNADTPTTLLEASVIQWDWVESVYPYADQFNALHQALISAWQHMGLKNRVYFCAVKHHPEDKANVVYLQDTAAQAGLQTAFIYIEDICTDEVELFDNHGQEIATLFKLYPWEWLTSEDFFAILAKRVISIIEPAWKMVLSNKGLLPILWELFPDHPYLLPAYFTPNKLSRKYVKKPFFSREGANITIFDQDKAILATQGDYGQEGYIYQQYYPLPNFDNYFPVIGSWVIDGKSAGIGIREDQQLITSDGSRFVPHYFTDSSP